ncbi:MAG: DEAD/DEAH box helicase, partial [Treponema sp.]|nr:DEAD/DEAH box helicase [Treponema sp.]
MANFTHAYDALSSLPIYPFLDQICGNLKNSDSRYLVLTAQTAAGKSTALPLALLENFQGKILMLEPRRLAASAIADRLSDLLCEECGKTVGYRLHLDSKVSSQTRLEVITEAILTRRLQADPLLEDVNLIVLDEFHERSIHSDLALAFLKETMEIRDDLYVLVMSATIDSSAIAKYLGSQEKPAPVMEIPGRLYPVEIEYKGKISTAEAIYGLLKENKTNDSSQIADKDFRNDSILAFLPGIYEIRKTKSQLEGYLSSAKIDCEINILHSSISLSEQRKILQPCPKDSPRRVILSSAIAETSLTVPGVTFVVDSGLSRKNKMNLALGMTRLVTENESLFSARQRAGRAGRLAPGRCIRLWNEHDPRLEQNDPEILYADLSSLLLECAAWGADAIDKVDWLTAPPQSAWNGAADLLEMLECIEIEDSHDKKSIKITEKGKSVLKIGLGPRLACLALASGARSVLPYSEYASSSPERQKIFIQDLERRLKECGFKSEEKIGNSALLAGFPDRLARLSTEIQANADQAEYQLPSGRKALLKRENLISEGLSAFPQWLVAVEVDAGERMGKIYSFKALAEDQAASFLEKKVKTKVVSEFAGLTSGSDFKNLSVEKKEITLYGQLVLKEKKLPADSEDFALALCDLVAKKGLKALPIDSKIEDFLLRADFFGCKKLKNLEKSAEEWLRPFVKSQKINAKDIYDALYWYLDGSEIDRNVPQQLTLANGRKRKIKYEKKADGQIQPVLEIIIQQIFGCFENPKIMGKPLLLKLLSPASRPLQITDDLENFWKGAWLEICKEMKGRYPKHNWDYRQ